MRLPLHPFNPRPPPLLLLCDFSIFLFFFRGSIQNYFVPTRTLYFPFSSTSNPKNRIGTFQSLVSSILLFLSFFLPPAFFPLLLLTLCNFQIHRDKTDEPVPASLNCDFKREESIQYLGVTNSFSPLSFSPLSFSPLSFSTATGTARITSTFYSTSFFHLSFLQFPNSRRRIVLALNSGRANHPSFLPSFLPCLLPVFPLSFRIFVILKPRPTNKTGSKLSLNFVIPNAIIQSSVTVTASSRLFRPLFPSSFSVATPTVLLHFPLALYSLFPTSKPEPENRIGFQRWHEWPRNLLSSLFLSTLLLCLSPVSPVHDFSGCSGSLPEFP